MNRAYSRLEIKSVDDAQRIISGIATSASTDRVGDIVEPAGAQFTLPIPLLWQHDSKQPIGEVYAAKATKAGIEISARIAKTDTPGLLKDRLDMAWQSIAMGLVRGLSIGFKSLEEAYDTATGGFHFLQWEWLELSAVTIPANSSASITAIKSFDVGLVEKGVVPSNVSTTLAPKDESWSGPTLSDFTAKGWADLSDAEKRHIAGHYAWAAENPPASFGDLKLPHHDPKDGDVVWRGVTAAAGRLDQTSLPAADVAAVKAHLANHYKQFGEKAPWEPKAAPAATGTSAHPSHSSGASDKTRVVSMRTDTKTMKKPIADQIASWEATRAAKAARMDELLTKSGEAGTTLDTTEAEEHDTLDGEIVEIDKQLERLRKAEAREKAAAAPVRGQTQAQATQTRHSITVERKLPPGILFARYAMCMGASRGMPGEAMRLAQKHYPDDPGVLALVERTAVAGGTTAGSHWLDDMVPYNVMADFIEFLRPGSIIGKFGGPNPGGGPDYPSLRRVGFNERVSGMSTGFVAAWKGEGLPALPTAAVTFNELLTYNNMSALAVLTKEAIRFTNPSAEARVRDDLARAVNGKLDLDFIDPAKAASGTTSPASVTNGVVATPPTAASAAALVTDMATLLKNFTTNNLDASDIVLIMSASQALEISMMTTTLGMLYFPNISMKGGNFRGLPVITSEHLQSVGSPSINSIVALKAGEIYLADDGVVTVDASDQASLEMVDTSSQSAGSGTGASLVSLWQTGAVGLMATREITWKTRRSTAVAYISPAAYVA